MKDRKKTKHEARIPKSRFVPHTGCRMKSAQIQITELFGALSFDIV